VTENPLQSSDNRVALSVKAFLIFSVISILAVPLALSSGLTFKVFLISTLLGAGVTSLLGIIFIVTIKVFSKVVLPGNHLTKESLSILIILVFGLFRGILVYYGIKIFNYSEPSSLWLRMTTSTATTLLWFSVISIVVSDRDNFRISYESLVRNSIVAIAGQPLISSQPGLRAKVAQEIFEIESLLERTFGDIPSHPPTSDSLFLAAAKVRQIIDDKIRPLSRMLWMESASNFPKLDYRKVGIEGLRNLSVNPLYGALLVAVASIINISSTLGVKRGLFSTVTTFLFLFAFYKFQQSLSSRLDTLNLSLNFVLLLMPGFLLSIIFYFSNRYLFHDDIGPLNLIYVGICAISGLLISAFELTRADRSKLLRELELNLKSAEIQSNILERLTPEKFASYLHNSLQAELFAVASQIESLANNPQSDAARGFIERLDSSLKKSIRDDLEGFLNNPLARLQKIQNAWKGLASIDIDIPGKALTDSRRNFLLVQVIEESVTNAIRHGKSSKISILGEVLESGDLHLTIVSDGLDLKSSTHGFGSQWFDRFSKGDWSRRNDGLKTTLSITL
jgi:signal transduction histidine kinase